MSGSAEIDEGVDFEAALVRLMSDLNELEGTERRDALLGWVRSDWWSPTLMICEDWQGKVAREAWRVLKAELDASTPGKAWHEADHAASRVTINRLLGADGWKAGHYATFPFRMIWTQEDEPWIGAAIGCPPILNAVKLGAWEHIDIRCVILWNPKSGETRLFGDEGQRAHLILPEPAPETLDVFTDTRAFFSAWARQRASFAAMTQLHGLIESPDGHLPGALVIGGIDKVRFPRDAANALVARPPLTRGALRDAVLRSANLPRIEEARVAHG